MCQTFLPLNVSVRNSESSESLIGSITAHSIGTLEVATVAANRGLRIVRSRESISRSPRDHFAVALQLDGRSVVAQSGREALLRPGDLVFWDTDHPNVLDSGGPLRFAVYMVPRHSFPLPVRSVHRIRGATIRRDEAIGRLLSPFLTRLATEADSYAASPALDVATLELLAVAAREVTEGGTLSLASHPLLPSVHAFIERNLANPALRPALIAQHFGISTRYLHILFAGQDTTVGAWIRQRRLDACRRTLARPNLATQTIAAIAHQWGFVDAAHFSRTFRTAYGVSPRQWRTANNPVFRHINAK
ncbi:helix-turn-helix domain-containing protein [Longimycelium tulufanense]|nr:helix-turn-helix domain-containing protein [Longimycelium tulufanense]